MRGELKPFLDSGSASLPRFLRDEGGTATMEMLLWLPLLFFLLVLTIDASLVYLRHGEMWNVARDLARTVAAGQQSTTSAEISNFIATRYETGVFGAGDFLAEVQDTGTEIIVIVQHNGDGLSPLGIIEGLMGTPVVAAVRMRKEVP